MADLVQLDYEGKSVGLTPMNLSKTTIARFFRVHEDGLHLKIVKNGKCENVWPLSNGKFLLPTGTKSAHVVAFPAEDQDLQEEEDDDFQGTFGARATSHPIPRPSISGRSRVLSPPVTSAGFGKRPAPGFSFIKSKKKKQMNLVKDFTFSSLDEEGQMVMLFPISINLTELLERFGQLSVSIVCSAIEQELRDQGEVVRLVVLDARGQPIMDSSHTRKEEFWASQRTFRAMSQQTFRKWKPGVWAALSTGLYTLEDEEVPE
ncbi:unnamed protein product, partial [Porites lobata]